MDKEKLFYTEEHEWVEVIDDHTVRMGITDYAVEQLGDVVYVELPEVDDEFELEEELANVESVKSTSGIYAPLAGTIIEINEALEDEPEKVNEDSYELGWFCVIKTEETVDTSHLLSLTQYNEFIEE